jgi:hypothetical protein
MADSLLYPMVTRSDIQFTVCLCAHFQASPCTSHRQAVQQIFRYLKQTIEFGIWYSASSLLDLVGFLDTNFTGSGTCHFLVSSLICWSSQKQSLVAQSTIEAEYVAAAFKSYGLCTP